MTDVFVSYSSEDLERVKPLVSALEEHGWSVWWDRELVAGPSFDEKIEEALDAARCVVVVWSEHSVKSRWVRTEANEGLERRVLVPLLIDEVRPPLAFRIAQTARMIDWPKQDGQLVTLIDGITELLGQPSREDVQEINSIAVLPLVNMSSDPEQEFFSDGISEDILNGLVKTTTLKVIARTSSFQFKGSNQDIREIGEKLGVTHILEGSVRKSGDRIRVTVQLNRTDSGAHVWSEQYNRELTDVFAVQDEITESVLQALHVHLKGDNARPQLPSNMKAYDAYLIGQYHHANGQRAEAIKSFEQAVSLDPKYAKAYGALAYDHFLSMSGGQASPEEKLPLVEQYINRALTVDPHQPIALMLKSRLRFIVDREYQEAIDEMHSLVLANPSNVYFLGEYGAFYMQSIGRIDLSLQIADYLLELDPVNPTAHLSRGTLLLFFTDRHDDARASFEQAEQLGIDAPNMWAMLAWVEGDVEGIQNQLERGNWRSVSAFKSLYRAAIPYMQGDQESVRELLSGVEETTSYLSFYNKSVYARLRGEIDLSIDYFASALAESEPMAFQFRQPGAIYKEIYPGFYRHPRFQKVLHDIGLDADSAAQLKIPPLPF